MDKWTQGDLIPKENKKWNKVLTAIVVVLALIILWYAWCIYTYPCIDISSERCKEYAANQDYVNPKFTELPFFSRKTWLSFIPMDVSFSTRGR